MNSYDMAQGRDIFQLPPRVACASPLWKYSQENVVTLKMRPPQNAFTSLDTFMAAHSPRRFCQTRQKYVLKPLALDRKISEPRFVPTYERPESGNSLIGSNAHQRRQNDRRDSQMKSASNSMSSATDSSSEIEHTSTRVLALGKCTLSTNEELCLNDNASELYRNTSFRPGPKLPFTFKRSESIPNTQRDASDLIAIGTIPITTQKQAQPKPSSRSPSDEDNNYSPITSMSKRQTDEKLKPEAIWKSKATLNLKDNTSILGLTMDYGPCAFMDYYDPDYSSQQADARRRNMFRRQPEICKWNLMKLAEAIQDALPLQQSLAALEQLFDAEFEECYMRKMRLKLGLLQRKFPEDRGLVDSLLETMHKTGADFTNTFRNLCRVAIPGFVTAESEESVLDNLVSQCQSLEEAISTCKPVLGSRQVLENIRTAWASSPAVITHLETEISMHDHHNELIAEKLRKLKNLKPEEKEDNDRKLWNAWLSRYRSRLAQEANKTDDSSADKVNEERVKQMNDNNPRFVLRSYIAQTAIEAAEKGDFSEVKRVLNLLKRPYSDDLDVSAANSNGNAAKGNTAKGNKINLFCNFGPDCVAYDGKPPCGVQNIRLT